MPATQRKLPGPDHPITVTPSSAHVTVKAGDQVIGDSSGALSMQESTYPAVLYVPLGDLDQTLLQPSDTTSYCPYKGSASYYSIKTDDGVIKDAVWFYEEPYDAVAEIAGHVAFYPDRVNIEVA